MTKKNEYVVCIGRTVLTNAPDGALISHVPGSVLSPDQLGTPSEVRSLLANGFIRRPEDEQAMAVLPNDNQARIGWQNPGTIQGPDFHACKRG